jgi:hypothetical protein
MTYLALLKNASINLRFLNSANDHGTSAFPVFQGSEGVGQPALFVIEM